ncbi:leucine zipper putative tumor suppressor 2 isoform X2 [Arctopsyche grandis]|uniref:leucine zipper putative tumor suppressor 2 isoform X2 n=1 Tax=Arctopsyche grandis TaxID=121162 RepID=UPI00406D9CB6
MGRMGAVDSGNETLPSDDSPVEPTSPARAGPGLPPRIQPYSGVLGNGKVVIRPIAFKPMGVPVTGRLSNAGERYGSTPVLTARPGSHITIYGSSSDLRHHHHVGSSNYSLDRKLMSGVTCSPTLSSLPLPLSSGRKLSNYDSMESVRKSPVSAATPHSNGGHKWSYRGMVGTTSVGGTQGGSLQQLAPSPCDSGVSELEAALRDRDSELAHLRQTMEHNEQVIFRVYQEKERVWERELRRMKAVHESRLRAGAQKALKLEQMLMMQTYQLQQDKKRLCEEAEGARQEADRLRARLEDTEWTLCQKTGEISLLKTQLKDAQSEQTAKVHEILQFKSELRQVKDNLDRREKDLSKLRSDGDDRETKFKLLQGEAHKLNSKLKETELESMKAREQSNREIERLKTELKELREELSDVSLSNYEGIEAGRSLRGIYDVCKTANEYHWTSNDSSLEDAEVQRLNGELPDPPGMDPYHTNVEIERLKSEIDNKKKEFDKERRKWSEEKEKVLRYQKQLQLNYVQMFRKSRALEAEVESLTLELDLGNKHKNNVEKLGKTIEL